MTHGGLSFLRMSLAHRQSMQCEVIDVIEIKPAWDGAPPSYVLLELISDVVLR